MKRELLYVVWIIFFLAACNVQNNKTEIAPTTEITPVINVITLTAEVTETRLIPTTTMMPSPMVMLSATPLPSTTLTSSITMESSFAKQPIIHDQQGNIYETILSIPIGEGSMIQYKKRPDSYEGPNALAVLPDRSFMLADPVGERLIHVSADGRIVDTIELAPLGIGFVLDMRGKDDKIYLLEYGYKKFRVHELALDGALINTEEIPYDFPVGQDRDNLEVLLTGIAIDCNDDIILELAGGSILLPLIDVQKQTPYDQITKGISCNGQLFSVYNPLPRQTPLILAGDRTYETELTTGLGGFNLLQVYDDGSFYTVRDDVVSGPAIKVDLTVHYVDAEGVVQGAARIPRSEFYYYIMRSTAIAPNGEVFALLPKPDSLDIIRLNFYKELEPLIPEAVIPKITVSQK